MRNNTRRPCAAVILPSRDAVAYRRCADLARQVASRGWEVLAIEPAFVEGTAEATALRETGLERGVRQFVLDVANPAPFLGDTPSERVLAELLAGWPVDVVHVHLAGDLANAALLERSWLLGLPLVVSVHAGWQPPPGEPARVFLADQFTRADLVCVADHRGTRTTCWCCWSSPPASRGRRTPRPTSWPRSCSISAAAGRCSSSSATAASRYARSSWSPERGGARLSRPVRPTIRVLFAYRPAKERLVLVLTRRPGESVMVGDDVVVTVLDVRGDVVRLGIKAPRSIQVHREEVYRELQKANREAASPSDVAVRALSRMLRTESK